MSEAESMLRFKMRVGALLLICFFALAGKLAIVFLEEADPARFETFDTASYVDTAQAFLRTGRFALSPEHPDVPQITRVPAYPVFLAAIYAFGGSTVAVLLAQIALSLATMALAYFLAERLWRERAVAIVALLFFALDITYGAHTLVILTETLFAFFMTILLVSGLLFLRSGGIKWALLCGLSLALATLTRPISYYLVIPLAIGFWWRSRQQVWNWRRRALVVVLFIAPFVALVGGWQWRNWSLTGNPQLSAIEGINILFFRGAGIVALRDGISFEEARQRLADGDVYALSEYAFLHPEENLSGEWSARGVELIRNHPDLFIRTQLEGSAGFLLGRSEGLLYRLLNIADPESTPLKDLFDALRGRLSVGDYWRSWFIENPAHTLIMAFALAHLLLMYAGTFLWFFYSIKHRLWNVEHAFLWGVVLYLFVTSIGPEANARFRVPVAPVLSIYAAGGWWMLLRERGFRSDFI